MKTSIISLTIITILLIIICNTVAGGNNNGIKVNFNKSNRTFDISRNDLGIIPYDEIVRTMTYLICE